MFLLVPCLRIPMMIIIEKHKFVSAICRKCHCRDSKAWEAAFKSVPARERSCVSPCLAVTPLSQYNSIATQFERYLCSTHARAHGSFAGVPEEAASAFGEKPVRFCRATLRTLYTIQVSNPSHIEL